MNEEIEKVLKEKPQEIQNLFNKIEEILKETVDKQLEEKLWAKMPSYYLEDRFVRIIPFKDHINVEAKSIESNIELFKDYKITPRGMLQIYVKQVLPEKELRKVFYETMASN